jgi:hypothetical protein
MVKKLHFIVLKPDNPIFESNAKTIFIRFVAID